MNVLVACEYSGIVRDAFENKGWNAWSCDLLPTESEQTKLSGKHIQGDILKIIKGSHSGIEVYDYAQTMIELNKWDLLIAFPPCTYLSYVFMGERRYEPARLQKTTDAIKFFIELWNAPIEHICLENPVGVIQHVLPYSQIIQPYFWGKETGEDYTKRTCLWLKNLPKLEYNKDNNLFNKATYIKPTKVFYNAGGANRRGNSVLSGFANGSERSKFHKGIANAMAEQWTEYLTNLKLRK